MPKYFNHCVNGGQKKSTRQITLLGTGLHKYPLKKNIDALDTILYLQPQAPPDLDIYQGNPSRKPSAQLHCTKKACRQAQQDSYKKQQQQLEQNIHQQKETQDSVKIAKELRTIQKGKAQKCLYANMVTILQKQKKSTAMHRHSR
eukprot:11438881-Ditylum_brightwellii.AAC.1